MSWKLRHEGSTRRLDNLAIAQIADGLRDGLWEPTDEVMGPGDPNWQAIESHPQFAELVQDLQPPEGSRRDDETTLDMTPLIDVTLVLLIFFILVTTYQTLEKILDMPGQKVEEPGAIQEVKPEDVASLMIQLKVRQENGRPAYWLEGTKIDEADLVKELNRFARTSRKNELLLDAEGIDYGTVVKVIDAAGGARVDKVHFKTTTR